MAETVYLDNNATTRPLDEVAQAMQSVLTEAYANPSSVHKLGQAVRHRVECARAQVADLIGADPKEIVFTSGGTESINLAIRGVLARSSGGDGGGGGRVLTSSVEHSAVGRLFKQLGREGWSVDQVGVDAEGRLDLAELESKITSETRLVSLIWANNETGVLFDVEAIARITSDRGVVLHLDGAQVIGKVPVDVSALPVQLLSLSAHKFHGPKGIGALFVRKRVRLAPLIIGGRQERDRRGGTENVAGIVGMGVAAEAMLRRGSDEIARVQALRDRLETGICQAIAYARINGAGADRMANTTNIGFRRLQAEAILLLLSEAGICASAGAACSSGSLEPSHVLEAMGVDREYAHGSIRWSLSSLNTEAEIDRVIEVLPGLLSRLTSMSGV